VTGTVETEWPVAIMQGLLSCAVQPLDYGGFNAGAEGRTEIEVRLAVLLQIPDTGLVG